MGTGNKGGILFRKREALIVRAGAEGNAAHCTLLLSFPKKEELCPHCRGDGRQRGYSLSQKRIPPLKPPEKGLIGSLDLEGVQRLRSGSTCVAALLRSPPLTLQYDLTCSYYPLPLCLSCFSADESPPTASPIKAASAAKPPVRRQSAAKLPSLARYGVRAVDTGNDTQKTRGEATYTAPALRSACSPSSCKLPMSGVEGNAPRPSLGDTKGVFS